ncbi:hypothetical protein HDK77DRAFT_482557 [Phyllosticta capitalensis]|uniref:uncharacterized protein n=1 Tax=Phyllosticta capitalensis TaxID=121624 RepID=UPI003130F056
MAYLGCYALDDLPIGHVRPGNHMQPMRLEDEEEIANAHKIGDYATASRLAEAALLDRRLPLPQKYKYETLLMALPGRNYVRKHLDNASHALRIVEERLVDYPNVAYKYGKMIEGMRDYLDETELFTPSEDEDMDSDSEDGQTSDGEIELGFGPGQTFLDDYFTLSRMPVEAKKTLMEPTVKVKLYRTPFLFQTTIEEHFNVVGFTRSTKPALREEAAVNAEDLVTESVSNKRNIEPEEGHHNRAAKRTKVDEEQEMDNGIAAPRRLDAGPS